MYPDENNKNFAELFKLHAEGKINPEVSQKYSLEDSADAFLHLANRKAFLFARCKKASAESSSEYFWDTSGFILPSA